MLDQGKKDEALAQKKKDLERLKGLLDLDPTNTIKVLYEKTQKSIENLSAKNADISEVRKEVFMNDYIMFQFICFPVFKHNFIGALQWIPSAT